MTDLPPLPLADLRVLLVDDDEDTRELVAVVLQEAGAEVRSAGDVTEALQIVVGWSPCVVVTDLGLPKFDGFTLLRELRLIHPRVSAIAVTGRCYPKDREASVAAGFQEHVTKPFELDDLIAVVRHWGRVGSATVQTLMPDERAAPST